MRGIFRGSGVALILALGQALAMLAAPTAGAASNLVAYRGGLVVTTPHVHLVLVNFDGGDPAGEGDLLGNFLGGVGDSSYMGVLTQYCSGVALGTTACGDGGTRIQQGSFLVDTTPLTSDLGRTVRVSTLRLLVAQAENAVHDSSSQAIFVIALPHGSHTLGFGTDYCAYHSLAPITLEPDAPMVEMIPLNYMPDAGAKCGATDAHPLAGVTIYAGRELGETITNPAHNKGWMDANGDEIGDKCPRGQNTGSVQFGGATYPVQALWSNLANGGVGGCAFTLPQK